VSAQSPVDLSTSQARQPFPLPNERSHHHQAQHFDLLRAVAMLTVVIDAVCGGKGEFFTLSKLTVSTAATQDFLL
jgi:alpha-D-ribose 1-methylphosphonate 5-triphosphate synthase subunit PhnG